MTMTILLHCFCTPCIHSTRNGNVGLSTQCMSVYVSTTSQSLYWTCCLLQWCLCPIFMGFITSSPAATATSDFNLIYFLNQILPLAAPVVQAGEVLKTKDVTTLQLLQLCFNCHEKWVLWVHKLALLTKKKKSGLEKNKREMKAKKLQLKCMHVQSGYWFAQPVKKCSFHN